jgi:adenosylcobinamide-phosphate synthase
METVERSLYADNRSAGVAYAVLGTVAAATIGRLATPRRRAGSWIAVCAATYVTVAGRALIASAESIAGALRNGDVENARSLLPTLVGRDPSHLDCEEICRAVVESVAENTVDAVIAPAFWAAAGGPPAVLAYRAVNTLDSMVGHRSPRYLRFGWAAAKADDVANWVPARVTAILVTVVRPWKVGAVWRAVRSQAPAHPSPNAGVAEAAFAGALGIRLGGTNTYGGRVERRPDLGWGAPASVDDVRRANRLSRDVVRVLAAALALPMAKRAAGRLLGRSSTQ